MSSCKEMKIQQLIAMLEKRMNGRHLHHQSLERETIKMLRDYRDLLRALGDFE